MASKFENKLCLITGAASGIGRATAIKMSSLGAKLALQDLNLAGLEETNKLSNTFESNYLEAFNVGDSKLCNEFVATVAQRFGKIDFVFNCAGVNPTAYPLTETSDEYWDKLINTNLKGTYNVTRAVIPHMIEGNSIVNVSSTLGIQAASQMAVYCASKFGIVGFTKAMALELGPKGIRVNGVAPGYIDTPTNAGVLAGKEAIEEQTKKVALGRMGTPDEIADVVAFLFSHEARYMNGSIVEITGGRA